MARAAAIGSICLVLGLAFEAVAETYQVGPTRTYKDLGQVADLLAPGDVVEVDGGNTYPGGVTFSNRGSADKRIVIRGVNGRPVISGGTNTIKIDNGNYDTNGPGADYYTIENLEITGGTSTCVFHGAHELILRNLIVHDCPAHGILGADQGSGSVTLEYSEVYRCGNGDRRHQIYMNLDQRGGKEAVFRMQFCLVHDGTGGNNVKSRAPRNEIYYNWIEGAFYHELELIGCDPGGDACVDEVTEDSDVVGNVIIDDNWHVTRLGGDGTGESFGQYRFLNNTIVGCGDSVFRLFDNLASLDVRNNVFLCPSGTVRMTSTGDMAGSPSLTGSNNWIQTGTTAVPTTWTGTIGGTTPGFTAFDMSSSWDVRPAAGSPVIDKGLDTGLFVVPAFHPPLRKPLAPGAQEARTPVGVIDIGAFESNAGNPTGTGGKGSGTGGRSGTGGTTAGAGGSGGARTTTTGAGGYRVGGAMSGTGGSRAGGAMSGTGGSRTGGAMSGTGGSRTGGAMSGTGGSRTGGAMSGTGGSRTGGATTGTVSQGTGGTTIGAGGYPDAGATATAAGGYDSGGYSNIDAPTASGGGGGSGCGCATGGGGRDGWALLGLMALVALRRRSTRG